MIPQLTPQQLNADLSSDRPPLVLDVRMPAEIVAEGRIAQAQLLPLPELPMRLAELPGDREVVCVCRSGMRSFNAAAFLAQRGLKASSLAGGMMAWAAAGLPVAR